MDSQLQVSKGKKIKVGWKYPFKPRKNQFHLEIMASRYKEMIENQKILRESIGVILKNNSLISVSKDLRRWSLQQAISKKNCYHRPYTPIRERTATKCLKKFYEILNKILHKSVTKCQKRTYLFTEVTRSPDALLSWSSAPLAQLINDWRKQHQRVKLLLVSEWEWSSHAHNIILLY